MKYFALLSFTIFTSSAFCQLAKGDRILAWQVDMAENQNYDDDFAYAVDACMESIHLFSTWSNLEPTSGTFDQTMLAGYLDVANIYYPANGTKVELQLAPINTNVLELPGDLMSLPLNNQTVIDAFKNTLDTVFAHIPDMELAALNIGNESDIFLGSNASVYAEFKVFLDSVIPHAKQLYFNLHGTDLNVGTTLTFDGLTNPTTSALCQSLNANLDIVSTTYYPLEGNFQMEPASVVASDLGSLVLAYPDVNQPIYIVECGYASSASCGSSETEQAQFYENVFSAWDAHYDNIKYLTVFKSTDWSQADVDLLATYYGINSTEFKEYLRTLGVRTWPGAGTNKLAYEQIRCELDARGWCATTCSLNLTELKPEKKQLLKIVDFMGREVEDASNTPVIYIYSDGSTERKINLK